MIQQTPTLCPQHTFQVLTKRAARMQEYSTAKDRFATVHYAAREIARHGITHNQNRWPLPNVWLGVSIERQQEAHERIPHLLQTPAAVRFISAEPLLGPIDLKNMGDVTMAFDAFTGAAEHLLGMRAKTLGGLDWVIAGGESGPDARPMHPDWARSLRDQCAVAGVPFFFKQWGSWAPINKHPALHDEALRGSGFRVAVLDGDVPMGRFTKGDAGCFLDGEEHKHFPPALAA